MNAKTRRDEFICLSCPLGCILEVRYNRAEIHSVKGNRCKKGIEYAQQEVFDPRRVVTTTIRIRGARIGLLPVKTAHPVPRDTARAVVRAAGEIEVEAPVRVGDVVLENVCATGVNLVATRSCACAALAAEVVG